MAATEGQIRGMLLEESILFLLRTTGYRIVEYDANDPTLGIGSAGLNVHGRGTDHQIDAIADSLVQHPFSNPQRLLVEAKCYERNTPIGLPVVRNALGTLRDVSEFWVRERPTGSPGDGIPRPRYHYQYAVFSATRFTRPAQDYAYAQDIYLFPLARVGILREVIRELRQAATVILALPAAEREPLTKFRRDVRASLRNGVGGHDAMQELFARVRAVGGAMLATLGGRFPVFLTPAEGIRLQELDPVLDVRIRWDDDSWYIDSQRDRRLFTFDLPEELFEHYAIGDRLSVSQALNIKEHFMSEFQAVRTEDTCLDILRFRLEQGWLQSVREELQRRRRD